MVSRSNYKTKLLDYKIYFSIIVITIAIFGLVYNVKYTNIFPITLKATFKSSKNRSNITKGPSSSPDSLSLPKQSLQSVKQINANIDSYEWDEPLHPELVQNCSSAHNLSDSKSHGSSNYSNHTIKTPGCKIPATQIFPMGYKRQVDEEPDCSHIKHLATINDEKQVLELQESFFGKNCSLKEIIRWSDADVFTSFPEPLLNKHDVSKKQLLLIRCGKYFNLEANFPITKNVRKKIEYWNYKQNLPINVLLFGFDSISRADYHRNLPRTMKTAKQMGFVDFKGYHSIAPYSLENFLGFLVGLTVKSVRKSCAPSWNSSFDSCPHIWKYYSENRFITMYGEDGSQAFNWGGQGGFLKQPTDYYLHPMFTFYQLLQKQYPGRFSNCFNHKVNVQNFLNEYQRRFVKRFENTPFFSFVWNNDATHDYRYKLAGMDNSINKLLLAVNSSEQLLRRTMIIIVSDHGRRFGDIDYQDAFLERSLPGLFVRLPEILHEKYPDFRKNLKINTRRLTTAFDISHTLKHLLFLQNMSIANNDTDFKPTLSDRSSLFEPISENRTCSDVNIMEGNCVCNTTGNTADSGNPYLKHRLVKFAFAQLNAIIFASKYRAVCSEHFPSLLNNANFRILRTSWNFTEGALKFLTNREIRFEVQLRVFHKNVTLKNLERLSKFVRITPYGSTSWCVSTKNDEDHMMKELCTCKNN